MAPIIAFFSASPIDWILIAIAFLVMTFESFRAGAGKVSVLVLALPVTAVLSSALTDAALIKTIAASVHSDAFPVVLVGALFLGVCFLLYRIGAFYMGEPRQIHLALLAGVAGTVVLLAFWVHVPALGALWKFGPAIQAAFAEQFRFWWILLGFVLLAFVRS